MTMIFSRIAASVSRSARSRLQLNGRILKETNPIIQPCLGFAETNRIVPFAKTFITSGRRGFSIQDAQQHNSQHNSQSNATTLQYELAKSIGAIESRLNVIEERLNDQFRAEEEKKNKEPDCDQGFDVLPDSHANVLYVILVICIIQMVTIFIKKKALEDKFDTLRDAMRRM